MVEKELRLLDRQARGSPRGRAGAEVSAENQGVGARANRRFPRRAVKVEVTV